MAIDLKNFIEWYKTHDVVLWDKKRTFREPSIKQLLALKEEDDANKLIKEILIDWDLEELDIEIQNLTKTQQAQFFNTLLTELGLK